MMTAQWTSAPAGADAQARRSLVESPDWHWGYRLIGEPLLRADDKQVTAFCGHKHDLGSLVTSLQDRRARAEIRARAERKVGALEEQLADLRRRNLPALEHEAEQELRDQRLLLERLAAIE
jgi:hypothetical protein